MSKFQFECQNCSAYIPIIESMYGEEKQCWKCSSMNTVPDYSKKNIDAEKSIKNNNKKNNQNHYKTTLGNKSKNELSELLNQISNITNYGILVYCEHCDHKSSITLDEVFFDNTCCHQPCRKKFTKYDYDKLSLTKINRYGSWKYIVDIKIKQKEYQNNPPELSMYSLSETMDPIIKMGRFCDNIVKRYYFFHRTELKIEKLYQDLYDTLFLVNRTDLFKELKDIIDWSWRDVHDEIFLR